MQHIDYAVIGLYFVAVISLGFWYRKRASKNLDAYFLGGRRMHWLALAMSGSVSNFDITGTMWIVSMLFLMGMRSMWIHWMWGWMMGAFYLAYMGKWVRRSRVMTGAEWMVTRFGNGPGGTAARMSATLVAVVMTIGMIAYAFQGIGKFAIVYFDFPEGHVLAPISNPHVLALIIMGATTFYVLLGGLFSVVVTDVIQTAILTVAAIAVAAVAYYKLSPDQLASVLPADWHSIMPKWRLAEFAGTENAGFEFLGLLIIVWIAKGLLLNLGGPGGMYELQRFLAARDTRDAAKIGAAWSVFLVVRWGLCMGVTLLALVEMSGVTDAEQVMPAVLNDFLPPGVKGLVIAGLLAAFMSTFSSTINSGASYIVRDLWQPVFGRRGAGEDEEHRLVRAGHIATLGIVLVGLLIGAQAQSIRQVWEWLMTALGAGIIFPNVLRWYWWRMNGWGYAAGTLAGVLLSLFPLFVEEALPMYIVFPPIAAGSLVACVVGALVTEPVDKRTITSFCTTVKPFGLWGPIRAATAAERPMTGEGAGRAGLNTVLGMVAVTGAYLGPMYLVGHWHLRAALCGAAVLFSVTALRFTWYAYLPERGED